MARVKMTMEQVAASRDVNKAKVAATTEADIQRHMAEDGETADDPDLLPSADALMPLRIRATTGLSQAAFAEAIGVPLSVWLGWELNRTPIDPAGRALLKLLASDPRRGLEILSAPASDRHRAS